MEDTYKAGYNKQNEKKLKQFYIKKGYKNAFRI